jgi:hypothetical protein
MRQRPQLEQLETRETPSSLNPTGGAVLVGPTGSPGVPFFELLTPGNGPSAPNLHGFEQSGNASVNAGVFGAPLVIHVGPSS